MYKRLNSEGYFQTIVTHVLPTAKQNHVLNPWVGRLALFTAVFTKLQLPE